ncbi:non-ribosomal peptide synthetase [Tahibacter amnicola]|uniref:Amino acid adenylation domain-containing protein n=1 Tax=Tahibacter amnicola TaxID=2976241 RepID=A0ABY6B8S0_9GAMM|nr:non-ribosomal peptide synthetase [Tahibacter amnicola]UXI66269.1 amino acid adenylation domain-containing protein [Tahibacter amnicola]
MTLDELLHALEERGLRLDHVEGRLRVLGDTTCVDTSLREALLAHKATLIALLGEQSSSPTDETQRPCEAPLTPNQVGILRSQLAAPASTAYHMPFAVRLRGDLRVAVLREALLDLLRTHSTLRMRYAVDGDAFVQSEIDPVAVPLDVETVDGADASAIEQTVARIVAEPFDLAAANVFRARLVRCGVDDHILVCVVHHIAADGWSAQILKRDLVRAYDDRVAQRRPAAAPAVRFIDVALRVERHRRARETDDAAFWRGYFEGLVPAPCAYAPDAGPARVNEVVFALPTALAAAIARCAAALGVTPYQFLLAALGVVLCRMSGQGDGVICRPQNNRIHAGDEGVVGLFLDALPLRIRSADAPTFAQLVARVADDVVATSAHAGFSLAQILDVAPFPAYGSHHPLQQVALNYLDFAQEPLTLSGLSVSDVAVPVSDGKFALNIYVQRAQDALNVSYHARSDQFGKSAVARLHGNLAAVLEAVCTDPAVSIGKIALPAAAATAPRYASPTQEPTDVPSLFRRTVAQRPDAIALVSADGIVSYRQLQHQVDALAVQLLALHASASAIVVILARRDVRLPVAMLACLQSGLVYTVVDADEISGRGLRRVADLPTAAWICTDETLRPRVPDASVPCLMVGECAEASDGAWPILHPDQPACLTFTSGSSGRPRGVLGRHASLTGHLAHLRARFNIADADRFAMLGGLMSDPLQRDVFTPLCTGGSLVIPDAETLVPGRLGPWLAAQQVTIANLTPGLARYATTDNPDGMCAAALRWVFLCGDQLRWRDVAALRTLAPRCGVVNLYGMTETQRALSEYVCVEPGEPWRACADGVVPLGSCGAGTALVVRTADGQVAGYGEPGDITIESPDLALGYLHASAATALRFVPAADGRRAVRSGDRGRTLPDGSIQYLGRADQQVNIGGMRFAPAEVEAVAVGWPDVAQCRCVVEWDADGDAFLTLYWTAADATLSSDVLRRRLQQCLPATMVPTHVVPLPAMPLNAAGKIDAARLVRPLPEAENTVALPPFDAAVAALWSDVLGVRVQDLHQDFFALGGSSLSALRLCERLGHVFGVSCPVLELFDDPSLRGCIARLRDGGAAVEMVQASGSPSFECAQADPAAPFGLTEVQQAYWIGRSASLAGGGLATAAYVELEIDAALVDRVAPAVSMLIARHPMLRAIVQPDGRQRVLSAVGEYQPALQDLRHCDADTSAALRLQWRQRMCAHTFDPAQWPLFDVRISRDEAYATVHMAVDMLMVDFWSGRVLADEFRQLLQQQPLAPPSRFHFANYVDFLDRRRDSDAYQAARRYWLARVDDLRLGPVLPAAATPARAAQYRRRTHTLDHSAWARLDGRARALGVTKAAVLLTAYAQVLAQWSEERRFSIMLTLYDRSELPPDAARTVGDFTSLLLVELELPSVSFADRVRYVQRRLACDLQHRAYGAVSLLRELGRRRGGGAPVFVPFVFTDTLDHEAVAEDTVLRERFRHSQTSQVFLDHTTSRAADGVCLHWNSVDDAFAPGLVDTLFAAYTALMDRLVDPVMTWDTASTVARSESPAAASPLPRIESGFVHQALSHPQRVALICGAEQVTYGQLLQRSAAVAWRLRQTGLARGETVAVVLAKSVEQIVAVIAVLLAGGAYVPVDPALPAARVRSMLTQAAARIGIVASSDQALPDGVAPLCIADVACSSTLAPEAFAADAGDPAYVIFTSGSTGTPKGVVMVHAAVTNTLVAINSLFAVTSKDRVFGLSSLSFDLSVYDIFGTFAAGAALVLPTHDQVQRPGTWPQLVRAHSVSVWNSVPALNQILLDGLGSSTDGWPPSLRLVMLSGDWIPLALAQRLVDQPGVEAISLGGATEAAIWSIYHRIEHVDPQWRSIPYGQPLPNQTIEVLREDGSPCPPLVLGEIHIGGAGLAREYCGDRARTSQSFVVYPGSARRRYRTGDLGRVDAQGRVELVGRRDHQVKIAGHRVELGEIESTLRQAGAFDSAIAIVHEEGGGRQLVAFVLDSSLPADAAPRPFGRDELQALREALAVHLPTYMLPRDVIALGAMPLSGNGKVDRAALARLVPGAPVRPETDVPALTDADPYIRDIAAMWKEVLPAATVLTARSGFFLGGGSSLSAMRVLNRINQHYGIVLSIGEFYRHESLVELAGLVERKHLLEAVRRSTDVSGELDALALEQGEL